MNLFRKLPMFLKIWKQCVNVWSIIFPQKWKTNIKVKMSHVAHFISSNGGASSLKFFSSFEWSYSFTTAW